MLNVSLVAAVSLGYILLIFLVAYYAYLQRERGRSIVSNPHIYSLSIAVYATSWTFYGSVGKAATTGLDFLLVYLGPSLTAFSWWFLLRKIVRIAKENNITSIADFISSRYGKSQWLGALVTIIAILGIMPYIALQLKAVSTTFSLITNRPDIQAYLGNHEYLSTIHPGFFSALILSVFSVIFGARHLISSERHEGLVAAVAVESIVKLVAFLLVGIFVCYVMFDGVSDIFSRMQQQHPNWLARLTTFGEHDGSSFVSIFTILFVSMSAVMLLPRQFHIMVIENSSEEHIKEAMWLFPAYMFLINIFVMPIAMAGILVDHSAINADYFVLTLPLQSGHRWLALVAFLGGFSAAAGMVIVESVAISTMFLNHLLMPVVIRLKPRSWFPFLLINLKRCGIFLVVFLGYFYQQLVGETYMLVNMGLISFTAAAQFGPALIGGLYWRRGNKAGAVSGILLGFIIWFYTLLFPSLVRSGWWDDDILSNGLFGIGLLKPTQLFGLSGLDIWSHALFWSMFFNLAAYLACSIILQQDDREKEQVRKFVDVFVAVEEDQVWERKRLSKPITIVQFVNLMAKFIGEDQAHAAISEYLGDREIDERGSVSEFELPNLKRFIEKTLAGSVGAAAAGAIVESYLSDIGSRMESVYDAFSSVRSSLAESREALYVRLKASEVINRNLELQVIMDDLLDLLQREFKFDMAIIRLLGTDGHLTIRSQKGVNSRKLFEESILPEIDTYIGEAFLANRPQFINDALNVTKPRTREIIAREGIKSFAHIPIASHDGPPIGTLSVFSTSIVGLFNEPFLNMLASLAGQFAQAVSIVAEKEAKEEERQQKEEAQLERAKVLREMELAKQIQLSLLPDQPPQVQGLRLACRCEPAAHVGGDYYDFFIRNDGDMDMVIADVSGHDVGAALIMVEARSVLRAQVQASSGTAGILANLNRLLYDDLTKAELFITMFYLNYDPASRMLTYSSAGHNQPLLLRNGGQTCIELDAEGLILGVKPEVIFEERTIELLPGDTLILYTDGITETEDASGELFGISRLCQVLVEHWTEEPTRLVDLIVDEIRAFSPRTTLSDDVSLVLLKVDER